MKCGTKCQTVDSGEKSAALPKERVQNVKSGDRLQQGVAKVNSGKHTS